MRLVARISFIFTLALVFIIFHLFAAHHMYFYIYTQIPLGQYLVVVITRFLSFMFFEAYLDVTLKYNVKNPE